MNKKTIIVTVISTLVVVILLFISFKAFSFTKLKNDCIEKNTKQEGYSMKVYFKADPSYEKINNFITKIKNFPNIGDVSLKTSEDALSEFREKNKDNKQVLDQIDNLSDNPLQPSIIINSKIINASNLFELEEKLKNEAYAENLVISKIDDGQLSFYQKELKKVEGASLSRDLFGFIFSGNSSNFFAKNYSPICYPNFLSNNK